MGPAAGTAAAPVADPPVAEPADRGRRRWSTLTWQKWWWCSGTFESIIFRRDLTWWGMDEPFPGGNNSSSKLRSIAFHVRWKVSPKRWESPSFFWLCFKTLSWRTEQPQSLSSRAFNETQDTNPITFPETKKIGPCKINGLENDSGHFFWDNVLAYFQGQTDNMSFRPSVLNLTHVYTPVSVAPILLKRHKRLDIPQKRMGRKVGKGAEHGDF